MEQSYFLAQLFGLTLIIFTVSALFRPTIITVAVRDLRPYSFVMLMAGFFGIVGGLAIILSHNVWKMDWQGLITLFGWVVLFKSIIYIMFPDFLRFTATSILNSKGKRGAVLIVAFIMGCYLTYNGFGFDFGSQS